jgi:hypothetical protein
MGPPSGIPLERNRRKPPPVTIDHAAVKTRRGCFAKKADEPFKQVIQASLKRDLLLTEK